MISAKIESLKCETGGSHKGYQVIQLEAEGALHGGAYTMVIYGRLENPNQHEIRRDDTGDWYFQKVKQKLAKRDYKRNLRPEEHQYDGKDIKGWLLKLLKDHGPWEGEGRLDIFTQEFVNEIMGRFDMREAVKPVEERIDPEEEAREAQQAAQLENWGAF